MTGQDAEEAHGRSSFSLGFGGHPGAGDGDLVGSSVEAEPMNSEVQQRPGRSGVLSRERNPCKSWVWSPSLTGSLRGAHCGRNMVGIGDRGKRGRQGQTEKVPRKGFGPRPETLLSL